MGFAGSGEEAGAEHVGGELDQAVVLGSAGHHLARTDDLADRRLGLALGLQADDLGRRGDRIAGGVLVEQFVGADLGFVALGLGHALAHRGAAGLHVGDADAVAIALDAGPVELAGQADKDAATAVDLHRLGRQLDGDEVVARTDVVAVLRVQRQSGGLGFARADVGAAPVDLELRLLQRVHQQFRGVVGADRLAVHPRSVECGGAGVDRGTEQRPGDDGLRIFRRCTPSHLNAQSNSAPQDEARTVMVCMVGSLPGDGCRGGLFGGDQTAPGRGEDEQDVEGGHGQGAEEGGFTLGIHGACLPAPLHLQQEE